MNCPFFVPSVSVCFNSASSFLQFLLPFLLTLCKNLALPPPGVYCSLLSWAPWFMMFVFSLLTIWGLLILSFISWSLWQVTLHLHNLNHFFQAGQNHSQRPFLYLLSLVFVERDMTPQDFVTSVLLLPCFPSGLDDGRVHLKPVPCSSYFCHCLENASSTLSLWPDLKHDNLLSPSTFQQVFYSFSIPTSCGIQNNISYPWCTESFVLFFSESRKRYRALCLLNN